MSMKRKQKFYISGVRPGVVIRADANDDTGSGHAMRCISIAQQIEALGGSVQFAVSDSESKAFVEERGFGATVLGASSNQLSSHEARMLVEFCEPRDPVAVLVDSYGVDGAFFSELRADLGASVRVAYIDDLYTLERGRHTKPIARPVDCVVNYSFDADEADYRIAYEDKGALCCVGPRFAPLRPWFASRGRVENQAAEKILVTTGATNPDRMLEKMAEGCLRALPSVRVEVVVGGGASFDRLAKGDVCVHAGLVDLSTLMRTCDLAVSAAGTTLYELCAAGVPTIAVPIVENQLPNAQGFKKMDLGLVLEDSERIVDEVASAIEGLAIDHAKRQSYSDRMRSSIDGSGAERIAKMLLERNLIGWEQ